MGQRQGVSPTVKDPYLLATKSAWWQQGPDGAREYTLILKNIKALGSSEHPNKEKIYKNSYFYTHESISL